MDKPIKLQIPAETSGPLGKALRAAERTVNEALEGLSNSERLALHGAMICWHGELQRALLIPKTAGASAGGPAGEAA
jgi:hypothetical protein